MTPDEVLSLISRYHHEFVVPDIERILHERISTEVGSLRNEMLTGFDAIYKRFDRLETEYYALVEAVRPDRRKAHQHRGESLGP